ncbi:MAG TPA: adenylyltransferase/cytidyltransferase family protein [Methylomirabilota bacterium]|jgi:cytidyltransferase-like protein|nr:adenylyltransferase/cytidyltransferase family protein [Methylomirabilota bacterium]
MKKSTKNVKVMVFGVFDLLHPGHLNFLVQARELGDKLIVSVARDINVFKVKGQKAIHDERLRLQNISLLPVVDKAVLGGLKDPWPHILKEKPDVIALGYDQKTYISDQLTDNRKQISSFENELVKHGLKNTKVVRMKPHWPEIYKSKIIRKNLDEKI